MTLIKIEIGFTAEASGAIKATSTVLRAVMAMIHSRISIRQLHGKVSDLALGHAGPIHEECVRRTLFACIDVITSMTISQVNRTQDASLNSLYEHIARVTIGQASIIYDMTQRGIALTNTINILIIIFACQAVGWALAL